MSLTCATRFQATTNPNSTKISIQIIALWSHATLYARPGMLHIPKRKSHLRTTKRDCDEYGDGVNDPLRLRDAIASAQRDLERRASSAAMPLNTRPFQLKLDSGTLPLPFKEAALAEPEGVGAAELIQCAPKRSEVRGNHRLSDRALERADHRERMHTRTAEE